MFIPGLLCLLFVYLMLGIMLVSSFSSMTRFQYSCLCVFPKLFASLFPAGPEIVYEQFLLLFMLLCSRLKWVAGFSHFPDKLNSSLSHCWDLFGICWEFWVACNGKVEKLSTKMPDFRGLGVNEWEWGKK